MPWQADALYVPHTVGLTEVWARLLDVLDHLEPTRVEVSMREDDVQLLTLLDASGFEDIETKPAPDLSGILWMDAERRPAPFRAPDGFTVTDRVSRSQRPHPMRARNGDAVEDRLRQCSLYDPELDLSVESPNGEVAGYALFWLDQVTGVGMLEPMRVEEPYQRRGLGRALLTAGLDRLARKGARRLKVGCNSRAGRNLYEGAGFKFEASLRGFRR